MDNIVWNAVAKFTHRSSGQFVYYFLHPLVPHDILEYYQLLLQGLVHSTLQTFQFIVNVHRVDCWPWRGKTKTGSGSKVGGNNRVGGKRICGWWYAVFHVNFLNINTFVGWCRSWRQQIVVGTASSAPEIPRHPLPSLVWLFCLFCVVRQASWTCGRFIWKPTSSVFPSLVFSFNFSHSWKCFRSFVVTTGTATQTIHLQAWLARIPVPEPIQNGKPFARRRCQPGSRQSQFWVEPTFQEKEPISNPASCILLFNICQPRLTCQYCHCHYACHGHFAFPPPHASPQLRNSILFSLKPYLVLE